MEVTKYKKTNGKRYGYGSSNIRNVRRRAKTRGLTVDKLLEGEKIEQAFLDAGYKFCSSCKNWKIFDYVGYCHECMAKRTRNSYNKEKQREYILKKKYGITIEEYNKMLISQNFKCAICKEHMSKFKKALAVDHDHQTGKIRGLLCGTCNRYLGIIKDDITIAKTLVEYLKQSKK